MIAITIHVPDPKDLLQTVERGALYDDQHNRVMNKVFDEPNLAVAFLLSAERAGVNLWYGMPKEEIDKLYMLWYDSYKRPE